MFSNNQKAFNQIATDMISQNSNDQHQVKRRTRIPFSKEEDQQLLQLVQYFGISDKNNWYFIANNIKGRTPRQCRERYQLFLCDDVRKKAKWTKEEDDLLISKYEIYGPHWKQMEQFFVGRTSYNIKNRFISLSRRLKIVDAKSENRDQLSNEFKNPTIDNKVVQNTNSGINNEYLSVLNESDFDFDFDIFPLLDVNDQYTAFE